MSDRGYLLPVVIALGLAISVVSLSALTTLSQNSQTLNAKRYNLLAMEAAQAGTAAAIKCIEVNQMDWDTSGNAHLQPQTDCHGANVTGRPTTVMDDGTVWTTFTVQALDNPFLGNTRIITSTGTATVKTSGGINVQTITKTVRTFGNLLQTGTAMAVGTGADHGCAVVSHKVYCWGQNTTGQLGNNSTVESRVPVAVDTTGVLNGKTATGVGRGSSHDCAVADGSAYCWGKNTNGQLGNNSTTDSHIPIAVDTSGVLSGKTVTTISAGNGYTCVVASGKAYCWGSNSNGQLGNNSTTDSHVPVAVNTTGVLAGKTVTDIMAGASHTCVVADGAAYCWGSNSNGQLGNNSTTDSHVPVAVNTTGVLAGKTATNISAGNDYSCTAASGAAFCWGDNGYGMLGNNSTTESHVPVAVTATGVLSGKTVTAVTASYEDTCAIASGAAFCWGRDISGSLGSGATGDSHVPVAVYASGVLSGKTVTSISSGSSFTCVVADNKAYCWGSNNAIGPLPGLTYNGTLGNDSTNHSSTPVAVAQTWNTPLNFYSTVPAAVDTTGALSGKTVTSIRVGDFHTCAVASSLAFCWGENASGQLGNSSTADSNNPVAVTASGVLSGKSVTAIGAGYDHTCTVATSKAYCWGDNSYGQLGNNSTTNSSAPVAVTATGVLSGKTVTNISAGNSFSCAIASSKAYCWGQNSPNGQLGNNSTTNSSVPVAVTATGVLSGKTVTAISAGQTHACAVANGAAYCWGNNANGQLGNNTTNDSSVPVAVNTSGVLAGKTVTAISAGQSHTCAVANSAVYCWGSNVSGQLGNGSTANSNVPVAVDTSGVLNGKTVTDVGVGAAHSCAATNASNIYCWGYDQFGQLGNNFSTAVAPITYIFDKQVWM